MLINDNHRCNNNGENAAPTDIVAPRIVGENATSSINESVAIFNHNRTFPKCLSRCNAPFSVQEPLFSTNLNESTEVRAGDKVWLEKYNLEM